MKRKIKGYIIVVPAKDDSEKSGYYFVKGPKFLYRGKIVKEIYEKNETSNDNLDRSNLDDNNNEEDTTNSMVESEIVQIDDLFNEDEETEKRTIVKPDAVEYISRYTAPKERKLIARIINRMKYEHDCFYDVEEYLDEEENAYEDLEYFKNSADKRDRKFYKRVQAYEDAEDDIIMGRTFMALRVTAAAALLATSIFAVKTLENEVKNLVLNSGYVTQVKEKSTLDNANEGQIAYAERRASTIDYDFKYISHDEILDTIIRTSSDVSDVTENRAMATMKNIGSNSDQKLLEDILKKGYEEYDTFSDEKKQELRQLIYEMLDEKAQIWIRNPENMKKIESKDNIETTEMESEK